MSTCALPPAPVKKPSTDPLESLFAAILATAAKPREQSVTLPAASYTDPAFQEFETAEIFRKEWISTCHVSQIPNAGDFVRIDLCG
ncbi:hypothetical protein HQ447_15995, partial [bacterium]|nr:hypothetical protein [bacterium]